MSKLIGGGIAFATRQAATKPNKRLSPIVNAVVAGVFVLASAGRLLKRDL